MDEGHRYSLESATLQARGNRSSGGQQCKLASSVFVVSSHFILIGLLFRTRCGDW